MGSAVIAQESSNEIEVGYSRSGKIDAEGFSLSKESTIKIEGHAGLFEKMGNDLLFYGWILDGKTREVVWDLLKEENDQFFKYRDPGEFSFKQEITLPAGDYEVYYAAGIDNNNNNININFDLGELIDLIFNGDSRDYDRNDRRYSRIDLENVFRNICPQ